jgi:hypothetical protein
MCVRHEEAVIGNVRKCNVLWAEAGGSASFCLQPSTSEAGKVELFSQISKSFLILSCK